jgi:hypothetical protein
LTLKYLGIRIDKLTPLQIKYAKSYWIFNHSLINSYIIFYKRLKL